MVSLTISTIEGAPNVKLIHAAKNKVARAEPVAALYEQKRVHHVGYFAQMEDELCNWLPGMKSPNRLDAMVYALTELMLSQQAGWAKWAKAQTEMVADGDGNGNGHHEDEFAAMLNGA